MVSRIVKVSWYPFDPKERGERGTVVGACRGVEDIVYEAFDQVPEVVVGVGGGGAVAFKDFVELCNNSFVVGPNEHRVNGMFDNVSDGP